VTAAVLDDGARVDVDLLVVGIGVAPTAGFVEGAPTSEREGALLADATLKVADGLWAAGDVVRFPFGAEGTSTRIEHWRVAAQMGRTAALGMLGRPAPFDAWPFFWTHHYTLMFQLVGHAAGWDEVLFQGEPTPRGFLAYYLRQGRLLAVAGAQKGRDVAAASECLRRGDRPDAQALRAGVDWPARLRALPAI
jgi:NADPH-dependent 2,4-dienoyl-CoA reductase/sulfur reductase-like enzyme